MCVGLGDLGFGPLPVFLALIFFIQTFFVYALAVVEKDVDPILPYLSSAADKRPQSCIFAIGTNVSSVLLGLLVLVRYRQLRGVFSQREDLFLYKMNWATKWFGYLSAVGMFIVANVQETAIIPVHMGAAIITFGGFCVYMGLQCYLTYMCTPDITLWSVLYYRLVFTVLSCISFVSAIGFGYLASTIYHRTYPDLPTPRPWSKHFYQPGYEYHQISAAAEWACAIFQIFFMQSFGPEFEEITVSYYLRTMYIPTTEDEEEQHETYRLRYAL